MNNIRNIAGFFIVAISVVFILIAGRSILIPFAFALILWFIIRSIRLAMDRLSFFKERLASWIKDLVAFVFILTVLNFMFRIVLSNAILLANSYEKYEANIFIMVGKINDLLHINLMDEIKLIVENVDFKSLLFSVFNFSAGLLSSIFLILIYTIFLLLEESSFNKKFRKLFPGDQADEVFEIIKRIEEAVSKYLGLKTLLSLATALLSYFALVIIGVDFPVFWAFLIFVLNYIPSIGSIVATIFPVLFSLLQFGAFLPPFLVLLLVGTIQAFIGNFLDPKLTGNSINLSPLVIILSLSFWGAIWGITGMLLSVPLMAVLVIIFSKLPGTKPIAVLLSGNGKID
jgi:predicted PurR-regulated permease PerM